MFGFACCGEMLLTALGVSSVVRVGIMGGRETLAGADSSVVARTVGGGRVTIGIIVDQTLVGVSGGDRIKGLIMGDVGHGLGVYQGVYLSLKANIPVG